MMPTSPRPTGASQRDPYAVLMTRDEATARAAALNADASADEHWLVRQASSGDWKVARLTGPGLGATRPTGTHSESRPRPEAPDDPRPALFRNIPPFGPA